MVIHDMAESPLMGWGRADVQPQFPQLQNETNKDAPVTLIWLQGLHVCRLLAHRLGSTSVFIIQEPCIQLACLPMQQEFTAATGLEGMRRLELLVLTNSFCLFTTGKQMLHQHAANHPKITAHMFL